MLRKVFYRLPPSMRLRLRSLWYLPYDIRHAREYREHRIPPKGLTYTGGGDFLEVGNRFLGYFIEFMDLRPEHHILDVGSGIGRMAVALTKYLGPQGSYDGFDVMERGVRWCQRRITPDFPNFRFLHVDLLNDLYKSSGADAGRFTFPYSASQFDRAIVISVFTHMLYHEVSRYLDELSRVLRPGGKVFVTSFLLNDLSRKHMQGRTFRFDFAGEGCYLMDEKVKAANVAYEESTFTGMCTRAHFTVQQVIYGTWSGRQSEVLDFQDILILERNPEAD